MAVRWKLAEYSCPEERCRVTAKVPMAGAADPDVVQVVCPVHFRRLEFATSEQLMEVSEVAQVRARGSDAVRLLRFAGGVLDSCVVESLGPSVRHPTYGPRARTAVHKWRKALEQLAH